ncbi:MAG: hypothetical protein ACTS45_00900 [Candidatus Hodgkinia cicadicola]
MRRLVNLAAEAPSHGRMLSESKLRAICGPRRALNLRSRSCQSFPFRA